jgi:hypothetical protein
MSKVEQASRTYVVTAPVLMIWALRKGLIGEMDWTLV